MIIEASESQELQWAGWKQRAAVSASLKAGMLKAQEELMFQFVSKDREKADVPVRRSSGKRNSHLLLCSSPSTDWMGPTTLRERSASLSPLIHMRMSPQNTLPETPRIMVSKYLGTPRSSQVGPCFNHHI